MYKLNGKNVTDIQINGINYKDSPDFVDTYIENATWEENNVPLNDDEIELLNADSELLDELIMDYLQGQADYACNND